MVFKEDFIDPSIAFFFATLGLVLSLVSNFYCRYVTFDVTFTELEDDEKVSARDFNFRAGIWNYEDYNLYYVIGESQIFLTRFYYCVPWNSQTMIEKDTNWTAAQVFTIISVVLGGIVGFVSCFICCTSYSYSLQVMHVKVTVVVIVIILLQQYMQIKILHWIGTVVFDLLVLIVPLHQWYFTLLLLGYF
eukprot:158853_1